MQRLLVGVIGALTVMGVIAASAEPIGVKSKARAKAAPPAQSKVEKQQVRAIETYDDIRANSQDPAGNYKGFPSWARAAFTNPNEP